MKKFFFPGILMAALIAASLVLFPAAAQQVGSKYKPKATGAPDIAMIFHKLSGAKPDFKRWAMNTDTYRNASKFDKQLVLRDLEGKMMSAYGLVSTSEPVVVHLRTLLSKYTFSHQGYMIDGFKEDTYFDYEFNGENYALVMPGLMDAQWLPVGPEDSKKIESGLIGATRHIDMVLYIDPKFADRATQMTLDGKNYWLLSGAVRALTLYRVDSDEIVWQKNAEAFNSIRQNELIKLYQ